jgi:DNA-binding IclR family transcriptional regulator
MVGVPSFWAALRCRARHWVVGAFDDEHPSLSLADIAAQTGLYKSTILRLIATLAEHGYVVQPDERTYRLGPMFGHLGGFYQRSFRLDAISGSV